MQNIATECNRKSIGDINLSPIEKKLQKRATNTKMDTTSVGDDKRKRNLQLIRE